MKQTLLLISSFVIATSSYAQIGAVAPNFNQTDLDGVTHNLYDYLNAGKVVVVDMSATWCPSCWYFHNQQYLDDLNSQFGPSGTGEAVVLFIEDDQSTSLADLYGTGTDTQGDWVTGANYPIINSTVVLPLEYGTGYPTISVICPMDKKIKANLWNYSSLAQMSAAVQNIINDCAFTGVDDVSAASEFVLYPNPASVTLTISQSVVANNSSYKIFSLTGQEIQSGTVTKSENQIGVSELADGIYFLQLFEANKALGRQKFIKSAQ